MRFIIIIIGIASWFMPAQLWAQDPHWEYIPDFQYTFFSKDINCFEDTATNDVYLYGRFYEGHPTLLNCNFVLSRFDGSNFESFGSFGNAIYQVTKFQNQIYVGGGFQCVDSNATLKYLVKYDGSSWGSVGEFNGTVTSMTIDGDYLYVIGYFTEINGQPMERVARFDGETWEAVPAGGFGHLSSMHGITLFQGEIYVCGSLQILGEENAEHGLRVMRNDQWEAINDAEYTENSTIRDMAEFKDKLYLIGNYYYGGFSIHTSILTWDGQSLTAPYPDFFDWFGNISSYSQINRLVSTSNYLYAGGGMEYIGDQEVNQLAAYDGEQWCAMYTEGINMPYTIYGMFSLQDTVYAYLYLNPYSDTLYPSGLYKWIGGDDFENCSPTAVPSVSDTDRIHVYPNPVNAYCELRGSFSGKFTYGLYDISGREILAGKAMGGTLHRLDCRSLPPGAYILKINSGERIYSTKILKR